jgi:GTPase
VNSDDRYVARLISALELGQEAAQRELGRTWKHAAPARVIGIAGPPGVGKSVLTGRLASLAQTRGLRVGVLAVDPSSPLSGGAILADRLRMQAELQDRDIFVRSLASRGALGGVANVVPAAVRALEASGYCMVFVETLGVGQAETDIARLADTVLVVQAPGAGDEVQALKAGLLEVADVLVLNKGDLAGADQACTVLGDLCRERTRDGWTPLLVRTVATTGEGLDPLWAALQAHGDWLAQDSRTRQRRTSRLEAELLSATRAELERRLALLNVMERVRTGEATLADAVREVFGPPI